MPTVAQVKQQLQAVGIGHMLMISVPLINIAETLAENELIVGAAQARIVDDHVIFVLTDIRALVFAVDAKMGLCHNLVYSSMRQIDYMPGTPFITLTLTTTDKRILLTKMIADKQRAEQFVTYLNTHISNNSQGDVPSQQPVQSDNSIRCPKCGSDQITANQKGFGLGKAAVGGVLLGPVGLLGGFLGSKKVQVTCLQCGHRWKAGAA